MLSGNITLMKENVFDAGQNKINLLLNELRQYVKKGSLQSMAGEQKQRMLKTINRKISDVYLIIVDLENDIKSCSFSCHIHIMKYLKKCRIELEILEKELYLTDRTRNQQNTTLSSNRNTSSTQLLDLTLKNPAARRGSTFTTQYGSFSDSHFNFTNNILNNDVVERVNIVSQENEKIGKEILEMLVIQRSQLASTIAMCNDKPLSNPGFSENIQVKYRSFDGCKLIRRILNNSLLPLLIAVIEIIILGYVIYFRFIKRS